MDLVKFQTAQPLRSVQGAAPVTGYVDIHAHLLPGIDDGPDSLADSIAMASAAAESGTAMLAATPHLHPSFPDVHLEELGERCRALQRALAERDIEIQIVSGAEISVDWLIDAGDAELEMASYARRGSDVLIETPPGSIRLLDAVFPRLRAKGYRVTLAHPERGLGLEHDLPWLRKLVDQGLVLAVNAGALLASRSSHRGRLARQLCADGLARVLVSDGHRGTNWRPVTQLAAGARVLADLVGPDRAAWMTRDVPRAILEGETLPVAPPVEPPRRHRWFSRR
jgi:protein-tyrosine phosphatase